MGFPFIIPFFGFGGGGLFGFLVLMTIVGVIGNAFRNNPSITGSNNQEKAITSPSSAIKIFQLQLGLLASAKELQEDLRKLASTADTSSNTGLQRVLQDTSLALLRQPELWVYANTESGSVPFNTAETTFNRLSMNERSKLKAEVTSNYSGELLKDSSLEATSGEADATNEFIVVTLLVAANTKSSIKASNTSEQLLENLRILG